MQNSTINIEIQYGKAQIHQDIRISPLFAIGRDAAVHPVARSPTIGGCHNFHPIIESVSEANTHQIHSNTNDM